MLKLYTWKTPNGYKVPIFLEELVEAGKPLEYEIHPVNISKGEQNTPEYLAINPNNKIPALIDEDAVGGPLTIFESGAILLYLAEKTQMPAFSGDLATKYKIIEWLMFQMASVGPMFGQLNHFAKYAPEKIDYAIKRYTDEVHRLLKVMDGELSKNEFLAGKYSIADIATYPWVKALLNVDASLLSETPHVQKWFDAIAARPGVQRGYEKVDAVAV